MTPNADQHRPIHNRVYANLADTLGSTRLLKLNRMILTGRAEVLLRLEFENPLTSVTDYISWATIEDAAISMGAHMCIASPLTATPDSNGKHIVTFTCSSGERYLSKGLFQKAGA